ncbi:hypothetical protein LSAT2_030516 [Lamellibrachia satsuma]|nr:hypothetical protein LSAT2_030516 [Lamellibrachia satsuma]
MDFPGFQRNIHELRCPGINCGGTVVVRYFWKGAKGKLIFTAHQNSEKNKSRSSEQSQAYLTNYAVARVMPQRWCLIYMTMLVWQNSILPCAAEHSPYMEHSQVRKQRWGSGVVLASLTRC